MISTIHKTTGIVLRIAPFSRTSQVVTWLTPDQGRVVTVIKGARRPKSAFLGQCDLFYLCELLYYSKEREGLHITREYSPLDTRTALRNNWRATVCASYFADLASRISQPADADPDLFALLDAALTAPFGGGQNTGAIFRFELCALGAIGMSPRLSTCAVCNSDVAGHTEAALFSPPDGGVLCAKCPPTPGRRTTPLSSEALGIVQEWQRLPFRSTPSLPPATPGQLVDIGRALELFIEWHLHSLSPARGIAVELV